MNVFAHMVFRQRGTDVSISKIGKTLRVVVEGATVAERVVLEIDHVSELKLTGLAVVSDDQ